MAEPIKINSATTIPGDIPRLGDKGILAGFGVGSVFGLGRCSGTAWGASPSVGLERRSGTKAMVLGALVLAGLARWRWV